VPICCLDQQQSSGKPAWYQQLLEQLAFAGLEMIIPQGQPASPSSRHPHRQQVSSQQDPYPHLPTSRKAKPSDYRAVQLAEKRCASSSGCYIFAGTLSWHTHSTVLGSPSRAGWKGTRHCSLPRMVTLKQQLQN